MTRAELEHAIGALKLAIANNACLDHLIGHGASGDCRDVALKLNAEQSRPVLQAILAALQSIK